ncbi:hypothetical protein Pelo_8606 [Pelomyxa schiedti]|nr:hypothetical protein Pelo_8606 [Pelomyxa schiedti]
MYPGRREHIPSTGTPWSAWYVVDLTFLLNVSSRWNDHLRIQICKLLPMSGSASAARSPAQLAYSTRGRAPLQRDTHTPGAARGNVGGGAEATYQYTTEPPAAEETGLAPGDGGDAPEFFIDKRGARGTPITTRDAYDGEYDAAAAVVEAEIEPGAEEAEAVEDGEQIPLDPEVVILAGEDDEAEVEAEEEGYEATEDKEIEEEEEEEENQAQGEPDQDQDQEPGEDSDVAEVEGAQEAGEGDGEQYEDQGGTAEAAEYGDAQDEVINLEDPEAEEREGAAAEEQEQEQDEEEEEEEGEEDDAGEGKQQLPIAEDAPPGNSGALPKTLARRPAAPRAMQAPQARQGSSTTKRVATASVERPSVAKATGKAGYPVGQVRGAMAQTATSGSRKITAPSYTAAATRPIPRKPLENSKVKPLEQKQSRVCEAPVGAAVRTPETFTTMVVFVLDSLVHAAVDPRNPLAGKNLYVRPGAKYMLTSLFAATKGTQKSIGSSVRARGSVGLSLCSIDKEMTPTARRIGAVIQADLPFVSYYELNARNWAGGLRQSWKYLPELGIHPDAKIVFVTESMPHNQMRDTNFEIFIEEESMKQHTQMLLQKLSLNTEFGQDTNLIPTELDKPTQVNFVLLAALRHQGNPHLFHEYERDTKVFFDSGFFKRMLLEKHLLLAKNYLSSFVSLPPAILSAFDALEHLTDDPSRCAADLKNIPALSEVVDTDPQSAILLFHKHLVETVIQPHLHTKTTPPALNKFDLLTQGVITKLLSQQTKTSSVDTDSALEPLPKRSRVDPKQQPQQSTTSHIHPPTALSTATTTPTTELVPTETNIPHVQEHPSTPPPHNRH